MTIPQGDPRGLHSVSERRQVTFASDCLESYPSPPEADTACPSPEIVSPVSPSAKGCVYKEEEGGLSLISDKVGCQDCVCENSQNENSDACTDTTITASGVPEKSETSPLPLLHLPQGTSCDNGAYYDVGNTKLSLNFRSLNQASSSTAFWKNRRLSAPGKTRYHSVPQEDFQTSQAENKSGGIFTLPCSPTPPDSPSSLPHPHQPDPTQPHLSVHNAEVHASFNSADCDISSSAYVTRSLSDVTFKKHSSITTENRTRDKKGSSQVQKRQRSKLNQAACYSSKSLDDLALLKCSGGATKKRGKQPNRSVSTDDLASSRIHRGSRHAADNSPPGSPSRCCLVSVSRVPMAAATSHLTLDSEYQTVRLAVLGAPGVGKSAIVKQFVMQQFLEEYVPTEQRQVFCPAVIINEHLYEVRIIDCPYIPYFPVNSLYEWTDFRGYGLRNATAYVLVYDITSEESFEYIKSLRLQILESRNRHDVPIFVVGNKHDLAEERGVPRREVANMVKKQWKCGYIECSAKYNWHIMLLFKELMKSIDYIDYGHKPTSMRVQDALRRNRCLIL